MPMRQWPPGFSVTIAGPLRAGLSLMAAVTMVQMLAGAVIAAVTATLVARALTPLWGAVAAFAVLVTPAVLASELNVVSEPLYIACLAVLLCAMTLRPERAFGLGLVAAAIVMVRYLGIAAVAAVGLGRWRSRRRRRRRSGAALPRCCPGSLCMARGRSQFDAVAAR